jgi:uncharacterized protein (DUF1800 family)
VKYLPKAVATSKFATRSMLSASRSGKFDVMSKKRTKSRELKDTANTEAQDQADVIISTNFVFATWKLITSTRSQVKQEIKEQ